jgi:hypothetical protein
MSGKPTDQTVIGLPPIIFMFTIDQIASMLNIDERTVMTTYLYYVGRSTGRKATHQMDTINIAPEERDPEWRVPTKEFLRWCTRRGIKVNQFSGMR